MTGGFGSFLCADALEPLARGMSENNKKEDAWERRKDRKLMVLGSGTSPVAGGRKANGAMQVRSDRS